MGYPRTLETSSKVLIWGESELALRLAVEIGRRRPVVWALPGELVDQPEGVTVLPNSRLIEVNGASGCFSVQIETNGSLIRQEAGTIVVLPELDLDVPAAFRNNEEIDQAQTIVMVVDGVRPGCYREIVGGARALSRRGHRVYLIVDEVQVGFPGGEEMFQEACREGVVFLKDTVVYFDSRSAGCGTKLPAPAGVKTAESFREFTDQTLYLDCRSLGDTGPWVIEADRLWFFNGDRVRADYQQVREVLGVAGVDCQEYYPFQTRRKGILEIDPGWGEPFSQEEILAAVKTLIHSQTGDAPPAGRYEVRADLCALCLTCYRICPHGAVSFREGAENLYGQAMFIDPRACFNCGRCYAECPAQAIRQDSPPEESLGAVVLACENSGGPLLEGRGIPCLLFPCAGSIGITDMLRAWQPGIERLVIMTCRDGKCRHREGGKRLYSRVERLNRLLRVLNNPVHIEVVQVSAQDRVDEVRRRVSGL